MVCCMTCKKRSSLRSTILAASFSISIFFFSNSMNSFLPFSSEARKLSIIFCIDFSTLSSLLGFLFFFQGSPSSFLDSSEELEPDILMVQEHLQFSSAPLLILALQLNLQLQTPRLQGLQQQQVSPSSATGVAVREVEALDLFSGLLKPVAEVSKSAGGETDALPRITL